MMTYIHLVLSIKLMQSLVNCLKMKIKCLYNRLDVWGSVNVVPVANKYTCVHWHIHAVSYEAFFNAHNSVLYNISFTSLKCFPLIHLFILFHPVSLNDCGPKGGEYLCHEVDNSLYCEVSDAMNNSYDKVSNEVQVESLHNLASPKECKGAETSLYTASDYDTPKPLSRERKQELGE